MCSDSVFGCQHAHNISVPPVLFLSVCSLCLPYIGMPAGSWHGQEHCRWSRALCSAEQLLDVVLQDIFTVYGTAKLGEGSQFGTGAVALAPARPSLNLQNGQLEAGEALMILQQRCLLLAAKIKSAAQAPEVILHWAPAVGAFKVFGLYCQIRSHSLSCRQQADEQALKA